MYDKKKLHNSWHSKAKIYTESTSWAVCAKIFRLRLIWTFWLLFAPKLVQKSTGKKLRATTPSPPLQKVWFFLFFILQSCVKADKHIFFSKVLDSALNIAYLLIQIVTLSENNDFQHIGHIKLSLRNFFVISS